VILCNSLKEIRITSRELCDEERRVQRIGKEKGVINFKRISLAATTKLADEGFCIEDSAKYFI
jgi:hypothetical protein